MSLTKKMWEIKSKCYYYLKINPELLRYTITNAKSIAFTHYFVFLFFFFCGAKICCLPGKKIKVKRKIVKIVKIIYLSRNINYRLRSNIEPIGTINK